MKLIRWITTLCVLASSAVLAQTPVGWWRAEGNAADSSSTNNGTVHSTFSYVPGTSGQAFKFTGGHVTIQDAQDLRPASVTLQAWVKGSGVTEFEYIVCKSGGGAGASYAMYVLGGGAAFFVSFPGVLLISPIASGAQVWDNNWHQLTGTYDGDVCRIYLDGAEVESGTARSGEAWEIDYTNPQPLVLGSASSVGSYFYTQTLDDVKVFRRALSAAEVQQTFTSPTALAEDTVGWWKADGNALDSAGAHHGAVTSKSISFYQGKSGQGILTEGGSVRIPSTTAFESPGVTLQAWVQSVSPGGYKYIIAKSRPSWASYALYTAEGGGIAFFASTAGTLSVSPQALSDLVWDGAWHQVTGTYDGASVRIYLDGIEVGTGTAASGAIDYSSDLNGGALIIGNDPSLSYGYSGGIDEVKVFDRALTAEEILASYKSQGLVSWWRAEDNANDSLGSNHGTAVGTLSYAGGRLSGKAFQITPGLVNVDDSALLRPAGRVSLTALVSAAPPGADKYLVSKSLSSTAASYAFCTTSEGALAFTVTTAGGTILSPSAPVSAVWDGSFHLVAGVYDGQKVRLYLDGVEMGAGSAATGNIQYGTTANAGALILGDFAPTASAAQYKGTLDEVRLWDIALTTEQVEAEMYRAVLITYPPQSVEAPVGGSASFMVRAQGPQPLRYQWQFNGSDLAGATNSVLNVADVQTSQAGDYRVRIAVEGGMKFVTNTNVGGQALHTAGALTRVPNDPSLERQAFSLQAWVRAESPKEFKYLVTKTRGAGVASYAFYTGTSGGLFFYVLLDGTALVLSPDAGLTVWDGKWHQVTGTFDGQYLHLYVDGVEVGAGTDSFGGTVEYSPGVFNGDFIIGDFLSAPGINNFPGDLDEVKLFDHALTSTDVMTTWTDPTGTTATNGLVSWWKAEGNALDSVGPNTGRFFPLSGASFSESVSLTVAAPAILSNARVVSGEFQATLEGKAGSSYRIEYSGNLTSWTALITNTVPFAFTNVAGSSPRFYRAVAQP